MHKTRKAMVVSLSQDPQAYEDLVNDENVRVLDQTTFTTKEGDVLRVVDFDEDDRDKSIPIPPPIIPVPVC